MIVDLLYCLDFIVVCVEVCLVGKVLLMRILILLLALFPASVFAGVGDTYICNEKSKNWDVDRFILSWNADFYERRYRKGNIDEYEKGNFLTNEEKYFTSASKKRGGWSSLIAFDGKKFTEVWVDEGLSGIVEHICDEF